MNVFTLNSRGWNLTFLGQFEQGQKCFKKALQIQPNLVVVLNGYAFSLMMIGEYQKAQDLLDRSRTYLSSKITWFFRPVQALNFAYLGKKEKALKMNDGAGVHIVLKDYSRALDELEKIDTTAGPMSKTFHTYLALKNLPLFDPLRENPRFRSLLKKEEAKYLVNREKYIMIP
jgi:tetratricopeptide (TPR) repeat protein